VENKNRSFKKRNPSNLEGHFIGKALHSSSYSKAKKLKLSHYTP
jgi:hypothetical protein